MYMYIQIRRRVTNVIEFSLLCIEFRWVALNLETLANVVVLFTAVYAVAQRDSISAGLAGLVLTYSMAVRTGCMYMYGGSCLSK